MPEPMESEAGNERPHEDSPRRTGLHFHVPEEEDYTKVWPESTVHSREVPLHLILAKSALALGGIMALLKIVCRKHR